MCGVAGIYEYGRRQGSVSDELLQRMNDTIRHRGPDGEGTWISPDQRVGLASRRLAIVDIEHGAQPMVGENGEILVFNGEIYNYPDLRRRLLADGAHFDTRCDTEVVLRLYERHGVDCLDHLDGMFAIALWDPRRQRLLLARDRLGEKPLYWTQQHGRLLFGSEIKVLLEHPGVEREVNRAALDGYLAHLVTASPDTLYRGIHKLPPGWRAICDAGGVRAEPYWDLSGPREWSSIPLDEAATRVRELLDQSVDARLMSDVPVGVLLSGGLDSTTLVALLAERAKGTATFCIGYDEYRRLDERSQARRVAKEFGTDHYETVLHEEDAISFLPRLVHHQDEPLADPVCLPLHFICELARDAGIKVLLAGEGADELFWGYPSYAMGLDSWPWQQRFLALPRGPRRLLARAVPRRVRPDLRDHLDQLVTGRPGPMHLAGMPPYQRRAILRAPDAGVAVPGWRPSGDGPPDPLSRMAFDTQEYEFGLRLPELLLMRIDRFSMANGVEARVPFLSPALVEFVYRLPLEHKMSGGVSKRVLRAAVGDVVPDWVVQRRKQGFGAPVADWFGSRLGGLLRELMKRDGLREHFNGEAIERALSEHEHGRQRLALWPVLNFALWHRQWIEQEPVTDVVGAVA